MKRLSALIFAALFLLGVTACSSYTTSSKTEAAPPGADAGAVYTYVTSANDYHNWDLFPGKGKLYKGRPPHGALLTTYVNKEALSALNSGRTMKSGSILVKENYMPNKMLGAVTVMYKVKGFNPGANDWFWAKYAPNGKVLKSGKVKGCINCHGAKKANDYIFTKQFVGAVLPPADGPSVFTYVTKSSDYHNWSLFPGKGKFYKGRPPHGAFLTTYVNGAALDGLHSGKVMGPGSILVKENYMPNKMLGAVTVMYKVKGFNPGANDWFWAKYAPNGKVLKSGKVKGCINCHGAKKANDYIFTKQFVGAVLPPADGPSVFTYVTKSSDYHNWNLFPGKGKLYKGRPPHGALLTTYVNGAALDGLHSGKVMGPGSILVKENYMPNKMLGAVTVMYKVKGFNPGANDWFWAKYAPNGKVLKSGKVKGCINCHGAKKANDFIFTKEFVK